MASIKTFDIAVLGLGVIGAAVADALARAGARVAGFDRWHPPHDYGSSHGETRLLRTAYVEGDLYVPMVRRAIAGWRDLEAQTQTQLFNQTGIVYFGPEDGALITGVDRAAKTYDLPLDHGKANDFQEVCTPTEWSRRCEPEAGFINCEPAVAAFLKRAKSHGAHLFCDEEPDWISREHTHFSLKTSTRSVLVEKLVLCLGPFLPGFLADHFPRMSPVPLILQRRILHWYTVQSGEDGRSPLLRPFCFDHGDDGWFYGFPSVDGQTVKVSNHHYGENITSLYDYNRAVDPADYRLVDHHVRQHLPWLGKRKQSKTCLYTTSLDEDFILGAHPDDDRLFVATGLSGHGFKFAPEIGNMMTRALQDGAETGIPSAFSPRRFTGFDGQSFKPAYQENQS